MDTRAQDRRATLDGTSRNPVAVDLARTALVVVDMQNAFMSPGGMFDASGWPIAGAQAVIAPSRRLLEGLRAAGVRVVFT